MKSLPNRSDYRGWLAYLDAPANNDMAERVHRLQQACKAGVALGELLIVAGQRRSGSTEPSTASHVDPLDQAFRDDQHAIRPVERCCPACGEPDLSREGCGCPIEPRRGEKRGRR